MNAHMKSFGFLTALLAGALSLDCSVLYDLSPDQCGADSECIGRFGKGFSCDNGLCRGSGPSTDDDQPIDGGDDPPGCQSHAECIEEHGDIDPRACVEGECVLLKSDECPLLLPMRNDGWLHNLTTSDAIILGAFSPIPDTSFVSNYTRFNDLAVSDVTEEVQGLPGADGQRRQVVMVVCEGDTPTSEQLTNSATHLIDELKVPGIVSTLQSADLQSVFEQKGKAAKTFFISALDADDTILGLKDEGLVWTMLTGADQISITFPPLLDRVINYLRGPGEALGADEEVRVALVAPTGEPRLLEDMGQAIQQSIRFNGKTAGANFPDNFTAIDIVTAYGDQEASMDQSDVIGELLDFRPHVVLAMAANEFLSAAIPGLESQWSADSEQAPPFYVLSPYHLRNFEMPAALASAPGISSRMVGVAYAAAEDSSVYEDYIIRLDQTYPEVRDDPSRFGNENFYDAPYYLLYATAAAGSPPRLTGTALAQGMTRLIDGPIYEIGRSDMVEALGLLDSSPLTSITLKGTLGLAQFDASTGARNDAGSIYCIDSVGEFHSDIVRWDDEEEELVDADPGIGETCIDGF